MNTASVNGKFPAIEAPPGAGTIPHMADDNLATRIQRRLDRLGISARAASEKAGLGPDGVRNILRGKSQSPRGSTLKKLALVLECPVEYLLGHDSDLSMDVIPDLPAAIEAPPSYHAVPYIAVRASMGGGRFIEQDVLGRPRYFEEGLIASLRAKAEDLRAMEMEGQSMEPLLFNGDQVLVDTRKRTVIEPGIFVLFDGDGVVCKWVQRVPGSDPLRLRLRSENARFEHYDIPADQATVIGRVVWFARRM